MTSCHDGSLRSYGASGSNSTRTPMPRSVSRLAANAGWLASWGLQCGQECVLRQLPKRQKWQVRKSTAWLIPRQATKNGSSASGGSSRGRKNFRVYAVIAKVNEYANGYCTCFVPRRVTLFFVIRFRVAQ